MRNRPHLSPYSFIRAPSTLPVSDAVKLACALFFAAAKAHIAPPKTVDQKDKALIYIDILDWHSKCIVIHE